jgi:hypothetical protein
VSRAVNRAIRRLRADANRPHEALSLLVMVAAVGEQVEQVRGELASADEREVREILLDAAAALEREYNPKSAERQPEHERAST